MNHTRPNIVIIITDNQSPWTLGCYGNRDILTPNIDRLAREGVRFTNVFCVNPVCSPNRATLMTGLIPSRHGVHNWLGTEVPDAQMGEHAYCTIREFPNLPHMLASDGYDCGMTGKWHLGDSLHPQLGFRYWFTKPKGHTHSFYDSEAIWQGTVYTEPRYFPEVITEHAVDFLRQPRTNPFFLYIGHNAPYGLDDDMRHGHRNRHTAYYADKELSCFPSPPVHPWLKVFRDCVGNKTAQRSYAAAVSGVDDQVGAILETLAETGQAENTLVIFTADQGLCGGHNGMWGMGDHSRPSHMFQENLRVPLIVRHPARIPAGQAINTMINHYDFYPSALSYLDQPIPANVPGRSYAPALTGHDLVWGEEITFHEYEHVRAVQTSEWKLVLRHPAGPDELYHLQADPNEDTNLIESAEHAATRSQLTARLQDFFQKHCDPQYDLWHNGRSKAGRAVCYE